MKKFILLLLLTVIFTGCSKKEETIIDNSEYWKMEIKNALVCTTMSGVQSSVQYDGNILEIPLEEMPEQGNLFLLMNLNIEKEKSGSSVFSWKDLCIIDEEGNSYKRHPNDSFLEIMKYKRIKATDITLGQNEGYVCFEIPIEKAKGNLWLNYSSENDEIKAKIKIENKGEIK